VVATGSFLDAGAAVSAPRAVAAGVTGSFLGAGAAVSAPRAVGAGVTGSFLGVGVDDSLAILT
jgi:hypothetical protein